MPVAAPRFSRQFRRLCQVAVVSDTGRLQAVLDYLLPVVMLYSDGPWKVAADWVAASSETFGLDLAESDVDSACKRAIDAGRICRIAGGSYELSISCLAETTLHIEEAEALEKAVQEEWLGEVSSDLEDVSSDALWGCLQLYISKAFSRHGADAVKLLARGSSSSDLESDSAESDDSPWGLLTEVVKETGIPADVTQIGEAIRQFFDSNSSRRVRYTVQLIDATFNFMAVVADPEINSLFSLTMPSTVLFLDTNVILGIIGAHDAPLAAGSSDLVSMISSSALPITLYCHEKTLAELERVIGASADYLRSRTWPPALSRALLSMPDRISSIEVSFHKQNAEVPTSARDFMGRYSDLPTLLKARGIKIFRDPASGQADSEKRSLLVAEFDAYLKSNKRKDRAYIAMDHDMSIWNAASRRRIPNAANSVASGSMVVSADYTLRRFDQKILRNEFGDGRALVVLPTSLLQIFRPFVKQTADYDVVFARIFATPEFRGIGGDSTETIRRISSVLATYSGVPEETAMRLLTNNVLIESIRKAEQGADEVHELIENALIGENRRLLAQKDNLMAEAERRDREAKEIEGKLAHDRDAAIESGSQAVGLNADLQMQVTTLTNELAEKSDTLAKIARRRTAQKRIAFLLVFICILVTASVVFSYGVPPHWLKTHPQRLGLVCSADVGLTSLVTALLFERGRVWSATAGIAGLTAFLTILSRVV